MTRRLPTRVRVHWNLQRGGFSVSTPSDQRVIATPDAICLRNVRFWVSDKQLQRMRGLGKRKVVAKIEGDVCDCGLHAGPDAVDVTYNPWRRDLFHIRGTSTDVRTASHVVLSMRTGPDGVRVPQTRADDARS